MTASRAFAPMLLLLAAAASIALYSPQGLNWATYLPGLKDCEWGAMPWGCADAGSPTHSMRPSYQSRSHHIRRGFGDLRLQVSFVPCCGAFGRGQGGGAGTRATPAKPRQWNSLARMRATGCVRG